MNTKQLQDRLQEICDAGRSIQAESGGDRDYRVAAEKEANALIGRLVKDLLREGVSK